MDRRQLNLALHKLRSNLGRAYDASPATCHPVGGPTDGAVTGGGTEASPDFDREVDVAIDAFRHEQANGAGAAPAASETVTGISNAEFERDMQSDAWYDPQFANTWEEERDVKEMDMDQRVETVKIPAVVSRGVIDRSKYTCWCCGDRSAHDLQMPTDVFGVAYTKEGPAGAIRALKAFGEALVNGDYETAIARTGCCRKFECMIAQGKLAPENYVDWRFSGKRDSKTGEVISPPRDQLSRGTERQDQGTILDDNVLMLRWIFLLKDGAGESVLTKEEIRALFHWVILNSRFVQEREMRYIATAMAIVKAPNFPFKFADAQSFVDKMSGVPRTYCFKRLLEHIFDTRLDVYHWKSWGNRLLETAFPKAADTAYLLACRENWIARGRPRVDGRPAHRVGPDEKELKHFFSASGFRGALEPVTRGKKAGIVKLYYASARNVQRSTVKGAKPATRDETRALLKAISGSYRCGPMKAKPVKGKKCAPTDGARQADSSVHTEQRYDGACEGLSFDAQEKEDTLSLMLDKHKKGNSVGKEKLQGEKADKTKAKACAVLRPVEVHVPPEVRQVACKRDLAARVLGGKPQALKRCSLGAGYVLKDQHTRY